MPKTIRLATLLLTLLGLMACDVPDSVVITPPAQQTATSQQPTAVPPATATPLPTAQPFTGTAYGYTHGRADGNRYLQGTGSLPNEATPYEILLEDTPLWLTAVPYGHGSLWVVSLQNGAIQAYYVDEEGFRNLLTARQTLENGVPFVLTTDNDRFNIAKPLQGMEQTFTHPIPLIDGSNSRAFIDNDGQIGLVNDIGQAPTTLLPILAMPDARLLTDENGRILLLTQPTESYTHAVLGDGLEAQGILLLDTQPALQISQVIQVEPPQVIEGIMPIWADITGDGQREIIVTVSEPEFGARLVVYNEAGQILAQSGPIGRRNRWRNQAAVAPFGPNGELELADVRTPHLTGTVEFFQIDPNGTLQRVGFVDGYTSHLIGSRNLDMVLAGDFDGNGQPELLLPTLALNELASIQRTAEGAQETWRIPLNGLLTTNLAGAQLPNGRLAIGAATDANILHVWYPTASR